MAIKLKKLSDITLNTLTVLYGSPGTGKTTFIQTLPGKKLIIDTDSGTGSLDTTDQDIDVAQCETFDDVIEALGLWKDYDSIAIDHISNVQQLLYKKLKTEKKKDRMTLELYGYASEALRDVIDRCVSISNKGKNVVVLSQMKTLNISEDGQSTEEIQRVPDLQGSTVNYLLSNARVVANTDKMFVNKQVDGKIKRIEAYIARLKNDPTYMLKLTTPTPAKVPSKIGDPTWEKISKFL